MSTSTSEADIIFNRANVALAKSRRLIASWLPPQTDEELQNAKTEEQIEQEEKELFAPTPELLGLGAPLPKEVKDGDFNRQEISSNNRLRKQLLGKEFAKMFASSGHGATQGIGQLQLGSKPRPASAKVSVEEEEDEEGGRSSLGKSKRKRLPVQEQGDGKGGTDTAPDGMATAPYAKVAKRASNYMDEVLAERQRKAQKKRKKKKKNEEALASGSVP